MGKLYSALVAAPSKVLGGVSTVVGLGAAIKPQWVEAKIGSQVNADTIQNLGVALLAVSALYFCLLWLLKPGGSGDASTVFNNPSGVNIGTVKGGDFSQHSHAAPPKFRKEFTLTTIPPFMGGETTIDLDGVATLRLFPPYSIGTATLKLDAVPMKQPDAFFPDTEFRGIQITTGEMRSFFFDTQNNKRHTLEAGGKVFIVTLRETEALVVEGLQNPLKFVFSVAEA